MYVFCILIHSTTNQSLEVQAAAALLVVLPTTTLPIPRQTSLTRQTRSPSSTKLHIIRARIRHSRLRVVQEEVTYTHTGTDSHHRMVLSNKLHPLPASHKAEVNNRRVTSSTIHTITLHILTSLKTVVAELRQIHHRHNNRLTLNY